MERVFFAASLLALIITGNAHAQSWWKDQPKASHPTASPATQAQPAPVATPNATPVTTPVLGESPQESNVPTGIVVSKDLVLIPGDSSMPYEVLGNVQAEVKGLDNEAASVNALKQQAIGKFGNDVDAIIHFKSETLATGLGAGFALKGSFKWRSSGVAVRFKK